MGYCTRFFGEIRIDPPISWSRIKDSPFARKGSNGWWERDLKFHIVEETTDVSDERGEGTLIRREAVAIVTSEEDDSRGYNIVEHLQQVVTAYGEGRTFTGRLYAEGEEAGDLWRLEVHDGRAVRVEPRIVWPDGSEGLDH